MDDIILIKPVPGSASDVNEYRKEFAEANEAIHGSGGLDVSASYADWLRACVANEKEETVPVGRVPATQYLAVRRSDRKLVGMIQIRHALNDYLWWVGGHIGYSVRKSERRKGYATQMLSAALSECQRLGLRQVLITCEADNLGSAGVIRANGGVFERQIIGRDGRQMDRYWVTVR